MKTNITVGQTYTFSKRISDEDVQEFAQVTGDHNPLHLDEDYAAKSIFKKRIAHGMISAGVISGGIGMYLPGEGTTYLGQDLQFKNPVFIGDTITITLRVLELIEKTKFIIAKLQTTCVNEEGKVVTDGIATVIPPMVADNE